MNKYEIRVIPKTDADGDIYWTAYFPDVEGCIGGGATAEEAICEAQENLEVYLQYLKNNDEDIPPEYIEPKFSGKLPFRTTKTNHKKLADIAEREGVSINADLNSAVDQYLGMKQYDYGIDDKITRLQEVAERSLVLQEFNTSILTLSKEMWNAVPHIKIPIRKQ